MQFVWWFNKGKSFSIALCDRNAWLRVQRFAQKLLLIMFKLLIILEKKPKNYITSAIIADITQFQALTLEFLSFCELHNMWRTAFRAISRLPEDIRPDVPNESDIFQDSDYHEQKSNVRSHSFENQLNKLKDALGKKENQKAIQVFEQISLLLDNPVTSIEPSLVVLSLKRFISNEQALSVKLSYKKKEVYEEIIALNSKMSLQSQTSRETDEIRKKIQDSSDSIQRLESILIQQQTNQFGVSF